jgi:hypothetical protein
MKGMLAILMAAHAFAADVTSWRNLAELKPGMRVEISGKDAVVKGEFVRFDDQGITVRVKQGERSVAQPDVKRVALPTRSRGIWIGAVAGGGGGAIAGALLGARLENESGGDFANLRTAITGACAGAGALIGMAIGAAVRRPRVVYRKQ